MELAFLLENSPIIFAWKDLYQYFPLKNGPDASWKILLLIRVYSIPTNQIGFPHLRLPSELKPEDFRGHIRKCQLKYLDWAHTHHLSKIISFFNSGIQSGFIENADETVERRVAELFSAYCISDSDYPTKAEVKNGQDGILDALIYALDQSDPLDESPLIKVKSICHHFKLDREDIRHRHNLLFITAAHRGLFTVVEYLARKFGLTTDDAQSLNNNSALKGAIFGRHYLVTEFICQYFEIARSTIINDRILDLVVRTAQPRMVKILMEEYTFDESELSKVYSPRAQITMSPALD